MTRITSGLSQVGGKYRLLNTILNHIPYHEFYLEPFLGCYDDKTEILSKNKGWILFKDLSKNDKIACLSKRYELYWENPIALQSYYYEGKMIKISHRSIDLLVTPNHNMYLREFRKDYEFMKANDIKYQNLRCINSVKWNGKEKKYFNLPSLNYKNIEYKQIHKKIEEKWKNKKWLEEQYYKLKKSQRQIAIECGCLQGTIEYWMKKFNMKTRNRSKAMKILYDKGMQPGILNEKKKLPMDKWLRFLGWYISEGYTCNNSVHICQKKEKYLKDIEECIKDLGYNFWYSGKDFVIANKQLAHYLKNLGKAYEKYIPSEFMNLSRRQLKILFDSLIKGDGCISKGMISYYTSSKKLADQIQEICIKIGYNANIKIRDRTKDKKISNIKGRFIRAAHLSYEIYVRKSKECTLRRNQHFKKKYYEGMVYCCTVPNHVILVRRNGKTAWCGNSGIVILNKPRCRYECGNDINSEIINYLLVIREHPKEFDELKKGVFGLVSQEIYNRIINKTLKPKNNIERAYFFYYLNKLSFGGGANKINFEGDINESIKTKGHRGLIDNCSLSREGYGRVDKKVVENARKDFQFKTSNYGGIGNPRVMPQADLHEHKVEQYKKDFQNKINRYRGMTPKTSLLKNAPFKGLLPQTTRPHTNNDCGILTPIDPQAIKRLRYVNLTCYPFQKVYKMFHRAFHERKGLEKECFMYCDPPYPGTDDSYLKPFTKEDHDDLISILLNCPFHWLLSIGGECDDYLNRLDSFIIKKVNVKYSTSANYQYERREYLIMNYDIKKLPLMIHESSQYRIDNYIQEYKNE